MNPTNFIDKCYYFSLACNKMCFYDTKHNLISPVWSRSLERIAHQTQQITRLSLSLFPSISFKSRAFLISWLIGDIESISSRINFPLFSRLLAYNRYHVMELCKLLSFSSYQTTDCFHIATNESMITLNKLYRPLTNLVLISFLDDSALLLVKLIESLFIWLVEQANVSFSISVMKSLIDIFILILAIVYECSIQLNSIALRVLSFFTFHLG